MSGADFSQTGTPGSRAASTPDLEEEVARLRRGEVRLAAEHAVTRILAESDSLEEASPRVLRVLSRGLACELGLLWQPDPDGLRLACRCVHAEEDARLEEFWRASADFRFTSGEGLPGRVWRSGRPEFVEELEVDPNFPRALLAKDAGLSSGLAFPILVAGRALAVMEFYSSHRQAAEERTLSMMAAVGSEIGQFMERWRADAASQATEARHAAVLESALDCIVTIDATGRIVDFNPAAERTFGHSQDAVRGRLLSEVLVPPRLRDAHQAGLARFLMTRSPVLLGRRVEIEALRADGTEILVELAITCTELPSGPHFTGYIRDITARVAAEAELARARDEAQAASRAKTDFLAAVSHELRTPLAGILGTAELLQGCGLEPAEQEQLSRLRAMAENLRRLVEDLLDFAGFESGRMQLRPRPFELRQALQGVVDVLQPGALAKGLELGAAWSDRLPRSVVGDPDRLGQILTNLVDNAIKYSDHGRVSVEADFRLGEGEGEGILQVAVCDEGPGMADGEEDLFERFVQGRDEGGRRRPGFGLGLSIVRRLVALMGGEVGFFSRPAGGTTFWVEIPLAPEPEREENEAPAGRLSSRVLLAEDNVILRHVLLVQLQRLGCDVTAVENGRQAVGAVQEGTWDLVLMDCEMPVLDGYGATAEIRRLPPPASTVPVVALTAHVLPSERDRGLAAGMDGYLGKPVTLQELRRAIVRYGRPRG